MPPRLSPTFLAAVVVAFLVLIGNAWLATRHREQATERVVTVREQIRVTDTLYRRDTITRREKITAWRTARDTLLAHDTTTRARKAAQACDSALASDSTALKTGERRVALRDTLVREVVKSLAPKPFTVHAEAYTDQTYRVGAAMRAIGPVSLTAEVEHTRNRLPSDDPKRRGFPLTGRVGVRITF